MQFFRLHSSCTVLSVVNKKALHGCRISELAISMVHNGKLQGIIDWSSARSAFAQEDCGLIKGVDWHVTPGDKDIFWQGYASVRPVPEIIRQCSRCFI